MSTIKNDYITYCLALESFTRRVFDLPYPMPFGDSPYRAGNIEQGTLAETCIDCLHHLNLYNVASDLIKDLEKYRGKSIREIDDLEWLCRRFNSLVQEEVFRLD